MEIWQRIQGFPKYSISTYGNVRNDETDRILSLHNNRFGILQVGLMKDRIQHKRSVTLLVATTFLPLPPNFDPSFDTPINLDGNRANNHVANLTWRPRWFAVKYNRQFDEPYDFYENPIEELNSGELFDTFWAAIIRYGVLGVDILHSALSDRPVWPTNQKFTLVEKIPIRSRRNRGI